METTFWRRLVMHWLGASLFAFAIAACSANRNDSGPSDGGVFRTSFEREIGVLMGDSGIFRGILTQNFISKAGLSEGPE